MRSATLGALGALAMIAVPAQGSASKTRTDCHMKSLVESYTTHYYAVKTLHGARAPGRNIRRWGLRGGRQSTCRQIAHSVRILRRMHFHGARLLRPGLPYLPPANTRTLVPGAVLSAIAQCESHGSPTAVSPGGTYRGKYQFAVSTWRSVGGTGDPAAAPETEQDRRAAMLYASQGAAPWPVCGR